MAIIIGDIHGYFEKAQAFLNYRPEVEHIALGDYVDSFYEPQNRQLATLQLLLDSDTVLLWGNHDLHYLHKPPWYCTGFQWGEQASLMDVIEANKHRFKAAYAVDGWLCTHAGVHIRIARRETDVVRLAEKLNSNMQEFLKKPETYQRINYICPSPPIFNIGTGRGGETRTAGIFWLDFKKDDGLYVGIKQIFGHTETPEPVVTDTYIALDTTNNKNNCWIYDTASNELVAVPIPRHIPLVSDLPEDEQTPFSVFLLGKTVPSRGGYLEEDYARWKARIKTDSWRPL